MNHGSIRDIPAFRQNEITKAGRNGDNFTDAIVGQEFTAGEVENAEVLIAPVRELKESLVREKVAVS